MGEIKRIDLSSGGAIFIEIENVAVPLPEPAVGRSNLPTGAEPCGATEKVMDTLESLKGTLSSICDTVHDSMKANQPDEWGVELNIGFKGTVSPIPVIVSGESNVAIKVHAKWKKSV